MAIQILLFGGRTACSLPVRDGDHDGLRFPGLSIPQVLNEIAAGYGTFVLKETQSQVLLCRPSNKRSELSLIHISEPTRRTPISYAVFCLKKKNNQQKQLHRVS